MATKQKPTLQEATTAAKVITGLSNDELRSLAAAIESKLKQDDEAIIRNAYIRLAEINKAITVLVREAQKIVDSAPKDSEIEFSIESINTSITYTKDNGWVNSNY